MPATPAADTHLLANGSFLLNRRKLASNLVPIRHHESPVFHLKRHQHHKAIPSTTDSEVGEEEEVEDAEEIDETEPKTADSYLERFCRTSTIHGVQDFYKATNPYSRIVWLVCIAAAFIASIFLCVQILTQFTESPFYISYMVRSGTDDPNRSMKDPNRLPDIVICPFGRFNLSFFHENAIDDSMIEYIQRAFLFNAPYKFYWASRRKKTNESATAIELDELLERLGNLSFQELILRASFPCNALIEHCVARSDPERGRRAGIYDCCADAEPIFSVTGLCYRIRGIKQDASGYGFGLTIAITAPHQFLAPGINTLHNRGVSVKLAEPRKGMEFDLTFIPTGVHALLSLKLTNYEFKNSKQYECLEEVADSYSATQCFDDCFFSPAMAACDCRLITATAQHQQAYPNVCKPIEMTSCLFPAASKMVRLDEHHFEKCQAKCKQACNYWTFQPTVSYSAFPEKSIFQYLTNVSDAERIEWENRIILDVFFEKLEYTVIKHMEAMTAVTFIANLGGQIGLWCGASVLSILQVASLLVGLAMTFLRRGHEELRKMSISSTEYDVDSRKPDSFLKKLRKKFERSQQLKRDISKPKVCKKCGKPRMRAASAPSPTQRIQMSKCGQVRDSSSQSKRSLYRLVHFDASSSSLAAVSAGKTVLVEERQVDVAAQPESGSDCQ